MSTLNKNNIFYIPKIEYDKSYETEGSIKKSISNTNSNTNTNTIIDLNNKINSCIVSLYLIPDDLKELVLKPLQVIQKVVGDMPDDVTTIKPYEEEVVVNNNAVISNPNVYPEEVFDNDDDIFSITITNNDKVEVIKKQYNFDLSSVIEDYVNQLNEAVKTYTTSLLLSFKDLNTELFDVVLKTYEVNTGDISRDYKHLSDAIIRSQIARGMKQKLYLKLYDIDKTINHIRSCKAGVEQRIRYYEEEYYDDSTFNEALSNKLLGQSRIMYDNKYKQNFFNLYKYLNSSVSLLKDCLNMFLTEAHAKIILIEKGEIDK